MSLKLFTDGASRGNPGPAGAAAILFDSDDNEIARKGCYLGEKATNNTAEYHALVLGLALAAEHGDEVEVFCDSELIVNQINGTYRVKNSDLRPLYEKVLSARDQFRKFSIKHVRRERNKAADNLANQAIDEKMT